MACFSLYLFKKKQNNQMNTDAYGLFLNHHSVNGIYNSEFDLKCNCKAKQVLSSLVIEKMQVSSCKFS
jgi:hypothetical protein